MTRYTRAKGGKGCNSKVVNEPTSWRVLKARTLRRSEREENGNSSEGVSERKQAGVILTEPSDNDLWFDFRANRKNVECGKVRKIRSGVESHSGNGNRGKIYGNTNEKSGSQLPSKQAGALRRKTESNKRGVLRNDTCDEKTISKKRSKGVSSLVTRISNVGPQFNDGPSVQDIKDLRRKEKALKREKKKVCFCCRRWGHQLADCPEFEPMDSSDVSPPAGGLCYHCGSTEHNLKQCRKSGVNSLKFARCFVCGEDGHLAKQCQSNPKGNYPKGGACRICGETSHLCSECPKGANKTSAPENVLSCTNEGPVDSLPEDMEKRCRKNVRPKKIIQF